MKIDSKDLSEVAAQLGDVYKGAVSAGRKRGGRARLGDLKEIKMKYKSPKR